MRVGRPDAHSVTFCCAAKQQLAPHWDLSIYLDVTPEESLRRALSRHTGRPNPRLWVRSFVFSGLDRSPGGLVVAVGVEDEFAEEFSGGGRFARRWPT